MDFFQKIHNWRTLNIFSSKVISFCRYLLNLRKYTKLFRYFTVEIINICSEIVVFPFLVNRVVHISYKYIQKKCERGVLMVKRPNINFLIIHEDVTLFWSCDWLFSKFPFFSVQYYLANSNSIDWLIDWLFYCYWKTRNHKIKLWLINLLFLWLKTIERSACMQLFDSLDSY